MTQSTQTAQGTQIFVNGRIFTSKADDDALYSCMAVKDGKIVAVGDEAKVRSLVGPGNVSLLSRAST